MTAKNQSPKSHECPIELWEKMTTEGREQYNKWMDILSFDKWAKLENGKMIEDVKILAHNAIIMIHPEFNNK